MPRGRWTRRGTLDAREGIDIVVTHGKMNDERWCDVDLTEALQIFNQENSAYGIVKMEHELQVQIQNLREQVPVWISVRERLPLKDEIVLAWVNMENSFYILSHTVMWEHEAWYDDDWAEIENVTHWQPLPAPPVVECAQ